MSKCHARFLAGPLNGHTMYFHSDKPPAEFEAKIHGEGSVFNTPTNPEPEAKYTTYLYKRQVLTDGGTKQRAYFFIPHKAELIPLLLNCKWIKPA